MSNLAATPAPAPAPAPTLVPPPQHTLGVSTTKKNTQATKGSATTRRSNIYLPNKRSAKHLWSHRKNLLTLEQLKSVADTEAELAVLESADADQFEDLDDDDKRVWKTFSDRLVTMKYAFKLLDRE